MPPRAKLPPDRRGSTRAAPANPGEVFWARFDTGKRRPWIVLWIDETRCCLAATTTRAGLSPIALPEVGPDTHLGNIVTVQPISVLVDTNQLGRRVNAERRAEIRAYFDKLFDLSDT